jgi:hypothetical protein
MAKSKTEGATKKTEGEAKARRAPARRPAAKKSAATPATGTAAPERTEAAGEPTHEEIARLAYQIYLERGAGHGRHIEDWLEAERILRTRK